MIIKQLKILSAAMLMVGTAGLLIILFATRASAITRSPNTLPPVPALVSVPPVISPGILPAQPVAVATVISRPAVVATAPATTPAIAADYAPTKLDGRHQYALGMLETGNDDGEIGGAGEVSRYQIMPAVWQHYSDSRNYRNPVVSLAVARQHWAVLFSTFKRQAHREPTDCRNLMRMSPFELNGNVPV